jgi:hypothetical protein
LTKCGVCTINLTPVKFNDKPTYAPPLQKTRKPHISLSPTFLPKIGNSKNSHPKNMIDAAASDYAATVANLDTGMTSALSNPNEGILGLVPTHHTSELQK